MVSRPWRFRSLVRQTYDAGVLSLLIVCAAGVTVGMVLALQGYNTLVRFGAESSLGAVVGLALIRDARDRADGLGDEETLVIGLWLEGRGLLNAGQPRLALPRRPCACRRIVLFPVSRGLPECRRPRLPSLPSQLPPFARVVLQHAELPLRQLQTKLRKLSRRRLAARLRLPRDERVGVMLRFPRSYAQSLRSTSVRLAMA